VEAVADTEILAQPDRVVAAAPDVLDGRVVGLQAVQWVDVLPRRLDLVRQPGALVTGVKPVLKLRGAAVQNVAEDGFVEVPRAADVRQAILVKAVCQEEVVRADPRVPKAPAVIDPEPVAGFVAERARDPIILPREPDSEPALHHGAAAGLGDDPLLVD